MSLLREAAQNADLQDPFVKIVDLGDFAITYRAAGVLTQVKQLLTARSNLRAMVLETLLGADIEIVSPHFTNQRQLHDQDRAMPPPSAEVTTNAQVQVPAERIFDKADKAEESEHLRSEHSKVEAGIKELEKQLKDCDETSRPDLEQRLARQQQQLEEISTALTSAEKNVDENAD
jgi:small conductance mechanosensitive channel